MSINDETVRRLDPAHERQRGALEWMADLRQDVGFAWRALRRAPSFAVAAVITLSLGIGANTAMFSVINATLLNPLPYATPDRLVMVWNHWTNWPQTWLSPPEVYDYAQQRDIFASVSSYSEGAANLTGNGEPERVHTAFIPAGFLATLGARPIFGREFSEQEDENGGPSVAILDYALWQRRYAGDRALVGRSIEISGVSRTIVGILPPAFRLPDEFVGDHSQVYIPARLGPPVEDERGGHYLLAVARLRPGITVAAANARLSAFIERFKKGHPNSYGPDFGAALVPMSDQVFSASRKVLLLLLGAVAFVLLIGCANVANLLLSRVEARQREIAIRTALGAGRRRLARQLLTESLLLGLIGGAVAIPIAALVGPALVRLGGASLPRADAASFDSRVLIFALATSIATSVLFGLAPVLHALRGDLHGSLRSRGTAGGRGGLRLRQLIITVQVALAVVSLAGATVMLKSFAALLDVPSGFAPSHVLTMRLSLPPARYSGKRAIIDFYADLLNRVRAVPGVQTAGAINALPLTGLLGDWGLSIDGRPATPPGQPGPAFDWQVATPGYIEAMGIRLRAGRWFTSGDVLGTQPVVVISDATAKAYWPAQNPVGAHVRLGGTADSVWREVIGVVADVHHQALDKTVRTEMYLPHAQFPSTLPDTATVGQNAMTLVIRTANDPTAVTTQVRGIIGSLDASLPVSQVRTLDDVVRQSVSTPRLTASLLAIFAALALVLSAIGVYGVMSYSVARRTNEIGIRLALGARGSEVIRLVVLQGMRPALAGLALGVVAAVLSARLFRGLVYGVSATDRPSLAIAAAVLGAVALLATALPARKVTHVDPVAALRCD